MLFNFILNQRMFLALARGEVGPILQALAEMPALPATCQWATFLRNHDEIDLGRLSGHEHDEVFAAFGPEPDMQLYERGIRRRLAPMLGNDRRRIEMAYALQFSLPGTPVIRYGDEIGMGEDLSLPERNAIRTPMQWSSESPRRVLHGAAASGSSAGRSSTTTSSATSGSTSTPRTRPDVAARLVPADPRYAARVPGVQHRHVPPTSTPASVPCSPSSTTHQPARCSRSSTSARVPRTVKLGAQPEADGDPMEVFADRSYPAVDADLTEVAVAGYGYRWIRLRRTIGAASRLGPMNRPQLPSGSPSTPSSKRQSVPWRDSVT